MKIKDSTIINMLMILIVMISFALLYVDKKIELLERQIAELSSSYQTTDDAVSEIIKDNKSQNLRLDAIEQHDRVQDLRLNAHREELSNLDDLFVDILEDMTMLEKKIDAMPKNVLGLDISEADIRNISALVYLEAGSSSCSDELQRAIASVIFNRMIRYHMTASQVIYQQGVFSPAPRVSRTIPSERALNNVRYVISNGCTLPSNVVAFRMGHYHSFGHRYCKIDNVYFTAI